MPCDAFVRVFTPNHIRLGMAIAAVHRYSLEPWNSLTIVRCSADDMLNWNWGKYGKVYELYDAKRFSQESRAMIEMLATTEVYAGIDDDMLIYGPDFAKRGELLMNENPDYAFVCAHPVNESGWNTCGPLDPLNPIVDSHAIGGPGFIRRGIQTDFPPISNAFYDGHIDATILAKGFKRGYARDLAYLHMGSRYSVASPEHCNGY